MWRAFEKKRKKIPGRIVFSLISLLDIILPLITDYVKGIKRAQLDFMTLRMYLPDIDRRG